MKQVALFVTCLVNNVKPSLGFDVVTILESCGYEVVVPGQQTCCGQPNYNGGGRDAAKAIARQVIDTFLPFEAVVIPSGSCGGMISKHYVELLADDAAYSEKATALSAKVYELSQFLVEKANYQPKAAPAMQVTYHDACAGLRELGIKSQPRTLLEQAGHQITELAEAETCCGFGGTFCVKYPDISNAMVARKTRDVVASGAEALVSGDLGCILNMEGKLNREGREVPVYHFAELLALSERESDKLEGKA